MKKRMMCALLVATLGVSLFIGCGEKKYQPALPTSEQEADIFVEKIDNLPEDFIKGMDISSVLAEEASGVKYYNEEGEEEDLFKILADSGVNYIRVRVWNHPFDAEGNGYGGGNCDVETAKEIGKRAAKYGMKLNVDFHYSDFWADPKKQKCPDAWKGTTTDEKAQLLYDYTVESLTAIIEAGADVGMVQVGNEINNGMSSVRDVDGILKLVGSGCDAVRKVAADKKKDIKIAVHYTEIDGKEETLAHAKDLQDAGVDYDIFGVSYYPYWHGTLENMVDVLSTIKEQFSKDTCILETSYCYTAEDGDCSGNSVAGDDCWEDYPVSVQGQATMIRDIMANANNAGALGVFYWEGAWVPVGSEFESNQKLWEQYGSGWASSYASVYDPMDAGKYYGGSSWDNQAMFDFDGKELPSLDVFKYVNYGATTELSVMAYKEVRVECPIHTTLEMPETVEVIYNDPTKKDGMAVTWDETQLAAVDTEASGEYQVSGVTEDGTNVTATVIVSNINLLANPGFDEADASMWKVNYITGSNCTDIQTKASDATSGENSYHFYSTNDMEFEIEQTLTALPAENYSMTAQIQGGDVGDDAEVYIYMKVGDEVYESQRVTLDGWINWKAPELSDVVVAETSDVTVGIHVKAAGGGWGTIDDVELYSKH